MEIFSTVCKIVNIAASATVFLIYIVRLTDFYIRHKKNRKE